MSNKSDMNSILIVSSSEQFNIIAQKALPENKFKTIEFRKSASAARRELLIREYDIVLVNSPLSDGMGTDFVLDIAEKHGSGVIIVVPAEIQTNVMNHLIDYGVIAMAKPMRKGDLEKSIRLFLAINRKVSKMRKQVRTLEDKMDELKIVSRAKIVLIGKGMTEAEAHDYIIREAMNNGLTKRQVAEDIIDDN